MDTITEDAMASWIGKKGGMGVIHRFMSIEKNVMVFLDTKQRCFVSIGAGKEGLERAEALKDAGATHFCVDVAHAHAKYVGKVLKNLRDLLGKYPVIMAGNVATYAGADYLASCGADIIKVGIGSGSVCTTRLKTGHGVPMITAIQECSKVSRSIVADGGIRYPGDIVKALAFGADFVMIGGMLAGTRPTPGVSIEGTSIASYLPNRQGYNYHTIQKNICKPCYGKVKIYRGMASKDVQGNADWKTAEGISVEVPYREDEDEILQDIIGGLRSGLTYAGAINIRELQRKLNWLITSSSGFRESLPHITTAFL
jgi:IMP dehydrogenase